MDISSNVFTWFLLVPPCVPMKSSVNLSIFHIKYFIFANVCLSLAISHPILQQNYFICKERSQSTIFSSEKFSYPFSESSSSHSILYSFFQKSIQNFVTRPPFLSNDIMTYNLHVHMFKFTIINFQGKKWKNTFYGDHLCR